MGKMPEACKSHHQRCNKLDYERRLYEVSKLLLQGVTRQGIFLYAQEKQWGVSIRQVEWYMSTCRKIWRKDHEKDKQADLDWHIKARENLYSQCVKEKEYSCAKDVLVDLTKLKGYYPVEKRALTAEITMEIATPEERQRRIAELETKRLLIGES
ncbi:MAG: hypothetical protein QME49_04785 [bacterium]|nr:hypothetical protein [bacterium]